VDAELRNSITTLQAIATARRLDTDDLATFRDRSELVLKSQSDWFTINLTAPSGAQVMSLLSLPGGNLPAKPGDPSSFERVLRTGSRR
jgi:hypothetical protein